MLLYGLEPKRDYTFTSQKKNKINVTVNGLREEGRKNIPTSPLYYIAHYLL